MSKFFINEVDLGQKKIIDNHRPKYDVEKIHVPVELIYLVEHTSQSPITYKGFEFDSQSDLMDFETVTALIRRREKLLKNFHDAKVEGKNVDSMTKEEALKLFIEVQEALIDKYKACRRQIFFKLIRYLIYLLLRC